jgi:hypothetical protein
MRLYKYPFIGNKVQNAEAAYLKGVYHEMVYLAILSRMTPWNKFSDFEQSIALD